MRRMCVVARRSLAAAAVMAAAAAPASAAVTFEGASALYYHFGAAYTPSELVDLVQSTNTTTPVDFDNGLFAFSIHSHLDSTFTASSTSALLTLTTTHALAASVSSAVPSGTAEAGAGLTTLNLTISITDAPALYTGDLTLFPLDGPEFPSGSIIPPGLYTFSQDRGQFIVDASTTAVQGQSSLATGGVTFNFAFTTVPAPAASAPILLALVPLARRRRPATRCAP